MASANKWNERFRAGDHASSVPDAFLVECAAFWGDLAGRSAADLACGAGRHAIWLAESGFQTTAIDFAQDGLKIVDERSRSADLAVETQLVDLETPDVNLGEEDFDLIVVVHFLHRPLFAAIRRALKPGGLLVYKTYTIDQLSLPTGPSNSSYVLESNELLREFGDYRVLRYEEKSSGEGTAALLAQKPSRPLS